jgi:hypothetical protein
MSGRVGINGRNLIAQYRRAAEDGAQFRGLSVLRYADQIAELCYRHGASTVLDYGSGAGDAYLEPHFLQERFGVTVTLFDPAFPGHDKRPQGRFDGVICSDVLEHIDEADVGAFVRDLFDYATGFVWASVCCRPAKKRFRDGRNMHVTVRPLAWWQKRFEKVAAISPGVVWYLVESE